MIMRYILLIKVQSNYMSNLQKQLFRNLKVVNFLVNLSFLLINKHYFQLNVKLELLSSNLQEKILLIN